MERYLCLGALCLLLGLGLLQTNAFDVEIKDDSGTCIIASINVNFTITYENSNGSTSKVIFAAPDKVTTEGSSCKVPLLNVGFGNNHSWSLNFTKNDTLYRGSVLTFTYNTNDTTLFPDAVRKGLMTVTQTSFFSPIPLNASYKCLHDDVVTSGNVVQLYWNVTLQAYVQNSTLGKEIHCSADLPTTVAPTTPNATTASTTVPPKPTPKPVDKPAVGNYSVWNGTATCLLASMGLQLNISTLVEGKEVWIPMNINPNTTSSSGSCGNESALLRLNDSSTTFVEFYFILANKKFHLEEVNVTLTNGSGTIHIINSNLSLWQAAQGNSYLCHKEQLIKVSEGLLLNTFDVQVQPFNVTNAKYDTASQCSLDDDGILIPIIVGAALSGLIVIIVIAYLIGRRKTYAGYQTL